MQSSDKAFAMLCEAKLWLALLLAMLCEAKPKAKWKTKKHKA